MDPWQAGFGAHQEAVQGVVAAVRAVPKERWTVAPAAGKWSAAEVIQHLIMTYEHLTGEQEGRRAIPVLVPRWKAWTLRQFALPRLLAGRPIPPGVRAPREVRPVGDPLEREAAIREFERVTSEWEAAMARNLPMASARAVHPFFGALPLPTMLRFATLHTNHHRRQIALAAEGRTLHGS